MKHSLSAVALAVAACIVDGNAHAQCTPQAESWITLEVVASEPAGDEPVEVIDIDRAGCASVRYASFDTRAGLYRRQLSGSERAALAVELKQRRIPQFDTAAVRDAVQAREQQFRRRLRGDAPERFQVACGDTYRLVLDDAAGAVQIEWYAPKQVVQRHREAQALVDLVAMIESLQRLGAAPGKTRIAEATP